MKNVLVPRNIYFSGSHVIGHKQSKESLEIAAAGDYNDLMSGPPGCGKSFIEETFSSIGPKLTKHAQLEVLSLHQLAGESSGLYQTAPFRHPHHFAQPVFMNINCILDFFAKIIE